jgi:hypothetical protein
MMLTRINKRLKNGNLVVPTESYCLADVKVICKHYGIKNSTDYREHYKAIAGLPAHPERVFVNEWISWYDLLDIPEPYSYQELLTIIHPLKLPSQAAYKKHVRESGDENIPLDPQGVYAKEWKNWYQFLGKDEPFKPEFIKEEYFLWGKKVTEFMKVALGGESKVNYLCRFIRYYIEKYDKSLSPEAFLTKQKPNVKPLKLELEKLKTDNMRRSIIIAVNEFLDYIIAYDLTEEDPDTGEIVRVMEARNPFTLLLNSQSVTSPVRSETTKPCLQYHFVKKAQIWIFPEDAKNFKDLKHLHKFDADWIKVPTSLINPRDPDCVYKKIGNQFYLWVPINWVHTYALTKVPLRGRQIAYNDSGEADDFIADIDRKGKIIWRKNDDPMAKMTKSQSFIKQMPDSQLGMYITTNKTSNKGSGYSIPWAPEDLAYWLIKLRKWQQAYNPINQPTTWLECKRTNINETQRKEKGINCFLFRAFNDIEPCNVGNALTPRLAAALYHIQPSSLELAVLTKDENTLSHYKSAYTPHSMRVSLVTAYIMEMGMPVEVVMKIVGHSSIVMSIYYCKITQQDIRERLEKGEKLALKDKAQATQILIEHNKIEQVKNQLVANNTELINSLSNEIPAGNFMFRDYGICPYGASRCEDGGEVVGATQARSPAPYGYLGMQNCVQCRHFITGPAFLGGLISLANEILLQANVQSSQCADLQDQIDILEDKINSYDKEEYIKSLKQEAFDDSDRNELEIKQRKLESEYESAAKKMDMFLCDLQSAFKLIKQSQAITTQELSENTDKLSLIKTKNAELEIAIEETSSLQQFQEVCENSTIYESASAALAITPRSQLLDRMANFNNIAPSLFLMPEKMQLEAGNQMVQLLLSRLKTWQRVNELVNGTIKLEDLNGNEQISKSEIKVITESKLLNHA